MNWQTINNLYFFNEHTSITNGIFKSIKFWRVKVARRVQLGEQVGEWECVYRCESGEEEEKEQKQEREREEESE